MRGMAADTSGGRAENRRPEVGVCRNGPVTVEGEDGDVPVRLSQPVIRIAVFAVTVIASRPALLAFSTSSLEKRGSAWKPKSPHAWDELAQELRPDRLSLRLPDLHTEDLAPIVGLDEAH